MSDWQAQYEAHLRSPHWRSLRAAAIEEARSRCQRCDNWAPDLQLHHKHYRTLGHETLKDVELLCPPCHEERDVERAREGAERARAALYNARLNGWAARRYGEDWADDPAVADEIEERFAEWSEAHE